MISPSRWAPRFPTDLVCEVDRLPAPGETLAADSLNVYPGGKVRRVACAVAAGLLLQGDQRRRRYCPIVVHQPASMHTSKRSRCSS